MLDQDRIEVYQDSATEWRWRLIAANNEIIADSAEGYTTRYGASLAAKRVFEDPPKSIWSRIPLFIICFGLGMLAGVLLMMAADDKDPVPVPPSSTTTTQPSSGDPPPQP